MWILSINRAINYSQCAGDLFESESSPFYYCGGGSSHPLPLPLLSSIWCGLRVGHTWAKGTSASFLTPSS
jgi:hypothetical protein